MYTTSFALLEVRTVLSLMWFEGSRHSKLVLRRFLEAAQTTELIGLGNVNANTVKDDCCSGYRDLELVSARTGWPGVSIT